jgi:hypothetical protein
MTASRPEPMARDKVVAHGRTGPGHRPTPDLPLLDVEMFDEDQERRPSRYHAWAELMERVYGSQVQRCPRGNSTLRLIALVTAPFVIRAIVESIGLSTGPRTLALPTTQGQLDLFEPEDLRPRVAARASCRSRAPAKPPSHSARPGRRTRRR